MSAAQIPQLDIRRFDIDRDKFVADFGAAYQEWGFAGITGHGLKTTSIMKALKSTADFFSLPEKVKSKYLGNGDWSRGYVPIGLEKAKGSEHADFKEFFHIGRDVDAIEHLQKNIWPTEIANFESNIAQLYSELDELGFRLLEVVALYLELPQSYFTKYIQTGEGLMRLLHYPPILDASVENVRAAAHEDINLLTLLVGSEQDGLEVLSRHGAWVPISIIEGSVVCNIGDMLQRLSNSKLPSTTHRVVNPEGADARHSRYSIPFFIHPHPDMRLDCLAQCIDDENPCNFAPSSAGEYHQQRLKQIGLLK